MPQADGTFQSVAWTGDPLPWIQACSGEQRHCSPSSHRDGRLPVYMHNPHMSWSKPDSHHQVKEREIIQSIRSGCGDRWEVYCTQPVLIMDWIHSSMGRGCLQPGEKQI